MADNARRTLVIRLIGIAMLVMAVFSMTVPPVHLVRVKNRCTESVEAAVSAVDGGDIQIEYILPGEDAPRQVLKKGDSAQGGAIKVFYNPDRPSEHYIEGFEESPRDYVFIGLVGAVAGVVALLTARRARRNPYVDDLPGRVWRG